MKFEFKCDACGLGLRVIKSVVEELADGLDSNIKSISEIHFKIKPCRKCVRRYKDMIEQLGNMANKLSKEDEK